MRPGRMILLGFFLAFAGLVIPLLMVMRVIEAGFLLSFLSHGASVVGLFLGLIGAAWYVRERDFRDY